MFCQFLLRTFKLDFTIARFGSFSNRFEPPIGGHFWYLNSQIISHQNFAQDFANVCISAVAYTEGMLKQDFTMFRPMKAMIIISNFLLVIIENTMA